MANDFEVDPKINLAILPGPEFLAQYTDGLFHALDQLLDTVKNIGLVDSMIVAHDTFLVHRINTCVEYGRSKVLPLQYLYGNIYVDRPSVPNVRS